MATDYRLTEWPVGNNGIDICIMHTLHVLLFFLHIPWRILNIVSPYVQSHAVFVFHTELAYIIRFSTMKVPVHAKNNFSTINEQFYRQYRTNNPNIFKLTRDYQKVRRLVL